MSRPGLVALLRRPRRHGHDPAGGVSLSRLFVAAAAVACLAVPSTAFAQLAGFNTKGDYGLMAGSPAFPGFSVTPMFFHYDGDRLRNASGASRPDGNIVPERRPDLNVNGYTVGLTYGTDVEFLGAQLGFATWLSLTDNILEAPALGLSSKTPVGFGDLYVQPLLLWWAKERADVTAGVGIFAPTGEYSPGGDENRGLGMWGFEFFGGTTVYFDEARNWHFATVAFYETHTKKRDTNIKVGDILTLEGGLGRSFLDGAAVVGLAYYAQWKLTEDSIGDITPPIAFDIDKHRSFGFGPEVTLPIATDTKLIALVNARFLWETGVRSTLEGKTLVVTATFPVPSFAFE